MIVKVSQGHRRRKALSFVMYHVSSLRLASFSRHYRFHVSETLNVFKFRCNSQGISFNTFVRTLSLPALNPHVSPIVPHVAPILLTLDSSSLSIVFTDQDSHRIFWAKRFLVHGQVTIIFVVSVCLSVCLCRVFLSRLWSDFDQTRTHAICLGLVVSPRI